MVSVMLTELLILLVRNFSVFFLSQRWPFLADGTLGCK